jgi:hypothetical protein
MIKAVMFSYLYFVVHFHYVHCIQCSQLIVKMYNIMFLFTYCVFPNSSVFKKCRKYFDFRIPNLNKFMFIILKLCYMIGKVIDTSFSLNIVLYVYPTVAISS